MSSFSEEDVVRLRAVFGRMARVFSREVETGGMTRTQLSILASVVRRGPIGLGELAEIEGINPTMLSRIVGKLDQAGLIERSPDEADRRAARVTATREGRTVHARLLADRAQLLSDAVSRLSPDEAAKLFGALEAMESLVGHAQPVAHQLSPRPANAGSEA
jgi:DNA-binding MarR family transcriptional regulator